MEVCAGFVIHVLETLETRLPTVLAEKTEMAAGGRKCASWRCRYPHRSGVASESLATGCD
ncbi:hypothetical protein DPMN_066032 [Dreissena polymorpha]|uniref:Uncharacterized protein n=1 Tax=Dreissena polymorpha TaxID=45954 RepID=A0A9D3YVL2_DREPO|nr:hypothetical protein DPMN_066032 [Dreissena polymorpha]